MSQNKDGASERALYEYEGKASLSSMIAMALQHVIAAVVGIITPAIMVGGVCGLGSSDITLLIQCSLLLAGIATILQLYPAFGKSGARVPMIMGASFAYVPILMSIGAQFGIAAIFGAQIFGGVSAILVGIFFKKLRPLFPPLVTGTIILVIGLSLYPVAVKYMAGGAGSAGFGSVENWIVSLVTLAVVTGLNYWGKGGLKRAAILIGIAVGYVVSLLFGMVDFETIQNARWFEIARPLYFGLEFHPTAIFTMVIMFVVNALQAVGEFTAATTGGMNREPTDRELSGGIIGGGAASVLGAFTGGLPVATYGQNVGIITVTKVINRRVFAYAAGLLFVAGLIPKFASVLTSIPRAVVGGATISVFASISMTGLRMLSKENLSPRNTGVIGLSLALGMGVALSAGCLSGLPDWVNTIFGGSEVILTTLLVILLNGILPKDKKE